MSKRPLQSEALRLKIYMGWIGGCYEIEFIGNIDKTRGCLKSIQTLPPMIARSQTRFSAEDIKFVLSGMLLDEEFIKRRDSFRSWPSNSRFRKEWTWRKPYNQSSISFYDDLLISVVELIGVP